MNIIESNLGRMAPMLVITIIATVFLALMLCFIYLQYDKVSEYMRHIKKTDKGEKAK